MKMKEDDKGKLVAKTHLEKTAAMGDGTIAKTVLPEAYDLNNKNTLLDTRGFLGEELDIAEDVLSTLILQFYHKYAKKVMVVYITEFENYSNLTKAHADLEILNKKCRTRDIPILFLANKCKEYQIMQKKIFKNMKENYQNEDTQDDAIRITKEAQDLLVENVRELKKVTIEKVVKRFSEVSSSMTLEQIIETLLRKEKGATGKEAEEARIGLNDLHIIHQWDKAIDEGRLLYYDPTLACSVERIIEKIEDLNNYRDPCDVNVEFNSKYYDIFIDSITAMANKYYWLALAMRGRQRIPNILNDIADACEGLAQEAHKSYSDTSTDLHKIEKTLEKLNIISIDSLETKIKNEKAIIEKCYEEIKKYQNDIKVLDKDEPVIYETIKFYEHSHFSSNVHRIYKKINVPNTTYKPNLGYYTFNDENEKLCIKDGKLQGLFRAPSADDEKQEKEKEKNEKEKMIEKLKNIEENWKNKSSKLRTYSSFCEESDKKWEENVDLMKKLYNFARIFIPESYINEAKREKAEETNFDNEASSSTTPSSSATASDLSASESRQAMEESSKSLSESKMEKKELDLSYVLQPNENFKIIAKFIDAMESIEIAEKYRNKIDLKVNDKYDPRLVSDAVDEIFLILDEVFECKGYLEEFKECSLKEENEKSK
ncbi:uncharacterized protein MONOS_8420 [Monocercomonoides exilis]|uniref:uncharacterized protein n=1 Tax=Monocercomonoides exilis TaxID=2049356 RepID=UPI00355A921E|nr:hypothetical protein MONOS_8420 [Monocercomonoides exilis]|eukprot:MONOS_8420.1-p1 / transcript=MONOS_8420.1 / gene=MONOS_8420 / organism=Monocercomonoides_exilis_PA203 / gene_product=unspecified product / transcript_product=unspecified product / location=Mono_scaffold00317:3499-5720(+) / protein_length=656 / sequence_SO=supercontig / SO=protein_coding / is_pseudo=false